MMKKLIRVEGLNYTIPYGAEILKDVSFTLGRGELLGVLGRNGSGKTTLIDLLMGMRPLTSGTIEILGENPMSADRKHLNEVCFLSHEATFKNTITIGEYLKFVSLFYPTYSKEEETFLLKYFSLNAEEKIGGLSTGQKKKVQIVGVLSSRPKILIVDEITAVLDPETRNLFFNLLLDQKEKHGLSVILATNIAEDLINRADRVLFVEKGKTSLCHPSDILTLFKVEKAA